MTMANNRIELPGRALVPLITIASSCGFLLFGYDNGVFSGIIVLPWFLQTFHKPKPSLLGTISATYNLGGFLGSMLAFFVGNALGRKRTILTGIFITSVGAIVQCVATTLGELVSGRIITGIGVGAMTSTVGLWQAETVPARHRGRYLCLQLLAGAAGGLFLAQWINYGFHSSTSRAAFVFPLAFQFVFLIACGVLVTVLPESPRWLVKHGRIESARKVLARLQGGNESDVEERLNNIVEADRLEKTVPGNQFSVLVSTGPTQNLKRLMLCCGTMIMHQLAGINSVTYYMPTLLVTFVGVSHTTSLWVAGLTSVTSIICALFPVLMIDSIGRRRFLWVGAVWQAVTFAILAAILAKAPQHGEKAHTYGVVAIVMVFLYYGGNSASWLPVSWCYPAEILPLQIREKGLALGNVCYWLFQFMIVEITPIALTNIKYKFYVIFAVLNVCIAVIVFFTFSETKGMSLEELDFYFVDTKGSKEGKKEKEGGVEHIENPALKQE